MALQQQDRDYRVIAKDGIFKVQSRLGPMLSWKNHDGEWSSFEDAKVKVQSMIDNETDAGWRVIEEFNKSGFGD